jgi:DNA-binding protein H-NS
MSEFTKILIHGRKLQGATKNLSVEDLELVHKKLYTIIQQRIVKEVEVNKQQQEKRHKLDDILQQMETLGLVADDIIDVSKGKKSLRAGQKRPVKYRLVDDEGNETLWTGIGRMPKVFANALADGHPITKFSI